MSEDHLFTELAHPTCPYCGSSIHLIIDPFEERQTYIEDCEVCCRPMEVTTEAGLLLELKREDD
ncbi:MAG: CPXCG motif-containing cysteine-rich protein [Saccharospirillum sp.]|nr:CPXCG motif-containing cysteine-rich protein [Saccharospirillum sp.]